MNTFRRVTASTAVAAVALLGTGCGDDTTTAPASTTAVRPSSSVAPGSSSTAAPGSSSSVTPGSAPAAAGTITVYSGRSESLVKPMLDEFSRQTGITVELRGGDSGEMAAQLITEGSASPADVFFSQDAGALGAVEKAGLFAPLPQATLDIVPAAYRSKTGAWVGTSGRARVIVYNPTLAPTPPSTIDELLDPRWKGKIGFAPTNASWQSFVTALRVLRGDDAARRWLSQFKAQDPKPYEKNGAVRDAVNSGEIALGLVNHYYLHEKIAKEGADKVVAKNHAMAAGDPGGLINVAGVGILRSSDNRAAAEALIAYLLSEDGQKYFAEKTFEYPLRSGVATAAGITPLSELKPPAIDLSQLDTLRATQELLAEVGLLTK